MEVTRGYEVQPYGTSSQMPNRQTHINSVMGHMRSETHTTHAETFEKEQDIKARKLEQISQLRLTLEEEGIDTTLVGNPTKESSISDINSVLKILKLKNDRNRYSTLAEEIILGFAEGVENVFDGSREVPVVGWKPDYTGFHNTINVKLHRMRHETSQIVGGVIEQFNISPSIRILLELFPSFVLHPWQQKKQRDTPGIYDDLGSQNVGNASNAYNAIRRFDANRKLDLNDIG